MGGRDAGPLTAASAAAAAAGDISSQSTRGTLSDPEAKRTFTSSIGGSRLASAFRNPDYDDIEVKVSAVDGLEEALISCSRLVLGTGPAPLQALVAGEFREQRQQRLGRAWAGVQLLSEALPALLAESGNIEGNSGVADENSASATAVASSFVTPPTSPGSPGACTSAARATEHCAEEQAHVLLTPLREALQRAAGAQQIDQVLSPCSAAATVASRSPSPSALHSPARLLPQLHIKDTAPAAFASLVEFLYTGDISIDGSNVMELLHTADQWGFDEVRSFCCSFCLIPPSVRVRIVN